MWPNAIHPDSGRKNESKNTEIIPGKWLNSRQHGTRHHLRPRVLQSSEAHTFNCINHMAWRIFLCSWRAWYTSHVAWKQDTGGYSWGETEAQGKVSYQTFQASWDQLYRLTARKRGVWIKALIWVCTPKALKFQEAPTERRIGFPKGEGGGYSWGFDSFWGPPGASVPIRHPHVHICGDLVLAQGSFHSRELVGKISCLAQLVLANIHSLRPKSSSIPASPAHLRLQEENPAVVLPG